jgi:hypothetical protein
MKISIQIVTPKKIFTYLNKVAPLWNQLCLCTDVCRMLLLAKSLRHHRDQNRALGRQKPVLTPPPSPLPDHEHIQGHGRETRYLIIHILSGTQSGQYPARDPKSPARELSDGRLTIYGIAPRLCLLESSRGNLSAKFQPCCRDDFTVCLPTSRGKPLTILPPRLVHTTLYISSESHN